MAADSMKTDLPNHIEALLFSEGGSLSKKNLSQLLGISAGELGEGLETLRARRRGCGVELVESNTEVALVVSEESAPVVQKAFERDYEREIGDAGLEVLAIVLYRGPSTRTQIDYIRGVNTSSTIRNLTSRGLIERAPNPVDGREYLYRPTVDLLAHLGVPDAQKLPEYAKITSELAAFEESQKHTSEPFENHAATGNSPE